MKPFLRPPGATAPLPKGWVAQHVRWDARAAEVAYDPRRHDVLVAGPGAVDDLEGELVASGWEYLATDGNTSVFARDRVEAARRALRRTVESLAPEPPSLGR